jgi:hypothetical protein
MKKWLRSYFHVPEEGNISEKVFLSRTALNISVIVLCMVAMVMTAYAYFAVDITTPGNIIQAAHFDVELKISSEINGNAVLESVAQQSENVYRVHLKADTVYAVEVTAKGTANTGFLVVYAGGHQYHTEQLLINEKTSIVFFLKPAMDMEVDLVPHWGTSSHYEKFVKGEADAFYLLDDPEGLRIKELGAVAQPEENTTDQ